MRPSLFQLFSFIGSLAGPKLVVGLVLFICIYLLKNISIPTHFCRVPGNSKEVNNVAMQNISYLWCGVKCKDQKQKQKALGGGHKTAAIGNTLFTERD